MTMLAFLPWATVKQETQVGDYVLSPWTFGQHGSTIDTILASYRDRVGNPVRSATLIHRPGALTLPSLSEDERLEVFELAAVLSFVGLARRSLWDQWRRAYSNTHSFALVIQAFDEGNIAFLSEQSRRRGGRLLAGIARESFQERMPAHVEPQNGFTVDAPLVGALLAALRSPERTRYEEALFSFNAANTDSGQVPEQHELVALVGALERLLQTGGYASELANAFIKVVGPLLGPDRPQHLRRLNRFESQHGAMVPKSSVRIQSLSVTEAWLRDLFRTRNEFGHGRRTNSKAASWSTSSHLLLGAHIFPLTVMASLQLHGFYQLTDEDREALQLVPVLVSLRQPLRWSARRGSVGAIALAMARDHLRFQRVLQAMQV